MREKLQRILGRGALSDESRLFVGAEGNAHQQWYQKDEELIRREMEALEEEGFSHECMILPDARAAFVVQAGADEFVITCSYLHPLQPPEITVFSGSAAGVADENGAVDLFAHDGFVWGADKRVVDAASRAATLISVARSTATSAPETESDILPEDPPPDGKEGGESC